MWVRTMRVRVWVRGKRGHHCPQSGGGVNMIMHVCMHHCCCCCHIVDSMGALCPQCGMVQLCMHASSSHCWWCGCDMWYAICVCCGTNITAHCSHGYWYLQSQVWVWGGYRISDPYLYLQAPLPMTHMGYPYLCSFLAGCPSGGFSVHQKASFHCSQPAKHSRTHCYMSKCTIECCKQILVSCNDVAHCWWF